jgi:MOSC domain-containing protein YiiM
LNIAGDGQADLQNHGGPDKAVLAYSADHYPLWRNELPQLDLRPGGFGENLTIRGITEHDVCIGDVWSAGDVLLEVSQPRQPCWKLARRWKLNDLPRRVVQTGRSGWYLRVLREGTIEPNADFTLVERRHSRWTVARVAQVFYGKHADPAAQHSLAQLDELSASWRAALKAKS